jgi:hypothetical protein
LPNDKEQQTLSSGEGVDHGLKVENRKRLEKRAVDKGWVSRLVGHFHSGRPETIQIKTAAPKHRPTNVILDAVFSGLLGPMETRTRSILVSFFAAFGRVGVESIFAVGFLRFIAESPRSI